MERSRSSHASPRSSRIERQLAPLKIISRLLGHELHAQQSSRVALSREELLEIQTSLDLYIDSVRRSRGGTTSAPAAAQPREAGSELEIQALPSRVN